MDVALRPTTGVSYIGKITSFNPCFHGCCSETLLLRRSCTGGFSFNPCFHGCCSETVSQMTQKLGCSMFQSLFSWMLLWDQWRDIAASWADPVSILVFMDVALRPYCRSGCSCAYLVSILVFMDVALRHCNRRSTLWGRPHVSILVFMDVALRLITCRCYISPYSCVSILVFMDVALRHLSFFNIPFIIWKFQSLFSWMLLWDPQSALL